MPGKCVWCVEIQIQTRYTCRGRVSRSLIDERKTVVSLLEINDRRSKVEELDVEKRHDALSDANQTVKLFQDTEKMSLVDPNSKSSSRRDTMVCLMQQSSLPVRERREMSLVCWKSKTNVVNSLC